MELISRFIYLIGILNSILVPHNLEQYGFNPNIPIKVSWYGEPFHGRRTASGEIYDMNNFTCASPRLPFNCLVTLRHDYEYITVRVNDRGPYAVDSLGRVIYPLIPNPIRRLDLSMSAFKYITNDLGLGIAEVYIVSIIER